MNANCRILRTSVAVIEHHVSIPYFISSPSLAISSYFLFSGSRLSESRSLPQARNRPDKTTTVARSSPKPAERNQQVHNGFRMACTNPHTRRPALRTSRRSASHHALPRHLRPISLRCSDMVRPLRDIQDVPKKEGSKCKEGPIARLHQAVIPGRKRTRDARPVVRQAGSCPCMALRLLG
jgi:hypothetical protein